MKLSNTWSALILIASALLLSAAPKGTAQEQSPRPAIHRKAPLPQNRKESPAATQADTVSPAATAVIQPAEPAVQTPVADNRASEIQQNSEHKKLKEFNWIAFWSGVRTVLQILFTLITTVATVYLARFTYQLVTVTGDLHKATQTGTEVARENMKAAQASAEAAHAQLEFTKVANEQNLNIAKQSTEAAKQSAEASARMVEVAKESARAAELALNAERPYVFLEGQQIAVTLCLSGFANLLKHPIPIDVSTDPLAHKGIDPRDAAELQLFFDLRNRGKGVAVIRNVHIRMLIGRGLEENGAPLWTAGRCDGDIQMGVKVLGLGETARVSSSGLRLNLDQLGIIKALEASLRFVVLVSYEDVYKRRYTTTFPFEYRAPVTRFGTGELLMGPYLLPALKVRRRRYG
jgi:hypothetical protein